MAANFSLHSHVLVQVLLILLSFSKMAVSQPVDVIQMPNQYHQNSDTDFACDSWRLSTETNNAGYWGHYPYGCESYLKDYMTGGHYLSDSTVVASDSLAYAQSVDFIGDGKDVWIFDIDDTLLYQIPDVSILQPLQASLSFYKELVKMNFTIILLSGWPENQRPLLMATLPRAGYFHYKTLILRNDTEIDMKAVDYKSARRQELMNEGYIIHGNSGDQWSDLLGYAVATRSFKVSNPMYYTA